MTVSRKKKKRWIHKLRNKYKLVIMNDQTYEERLTFRLSRMNVFVFTGITVIILIVLTTLLIAFTPLREYIPGFSNISLYEDLYRMETTVDSLEKVIDQKGRYLDNLVLILQGKDTAYAFTPLPDADTLNKYEEITIVHSREDSLLREEFESQDAYENYTVQANDRRGSDYSISSFTFFTPLRGIVTNKYNPTERHFGIDIVSVQSEAVKATLDGVVIITGWTVETGYIIGIQHDHNLFSIYKHNSALLKEQGSYVKGGDPIAIVGTSGEYSTGPHLHFELWYNGVSVDPAELINF